MINDCKDVFLPEVDVLHSVTKSMEILSKVSLVYLSSVVGITEP